MFREMQRGKYRNCGKTKGKTPQLFPITDLSCPFLLISYGFPYFLE